MIFVNYRKKDAQAVVDHLAERLRREFGAPEVFKDDEDLQGGEPWPERLQEAVRNCCLFLSVIGPGWTEARFTEGPRKSRLRLDDPADWVRREIETAVTLGKPIIPVRIDDAPLPEPEWYPSNELRKLYDLQGPKLRAGGDKQSDLEKLIDRIRSVLKRPAVTSSPAPLTPPALPAKPSLCFGRDPILAVLATLFLPHERTAPLPKLPLAGIGGIGKSTAALWFLHDDRVKARYGDRRHFIRLDGATSPGTVLEKLAESLAIPPGPNREANLWHELASQESRLVVLDNAETALLSEHRRSVEELFERLAGSETLGLIATLRPDCPIGAGWLAPLPVPELGPPPAREVFLANTSGKFAADSDLDAFLKALDGWPLVIQLAAERAKPYRSIKEFRGVWEKKRDDLLKQGTERGANFAVSVCLSLDHLRMTTEGRRLLAILAQLPDGVRYDDLEALLPGDGVEAAATLREVGGLVFDDRDRVRMLAPLREHLARVLPFEGEDRNRVVGFYCRVAEEGEKAGATGGVEAIARASAESDNCRSMIHLGLSDADPELAFRGALGFGEYARLAGVSDQHIVTEAANHARTIGNVRREADCALTLGNLASDRSNHTEAQLQYRQAHTLFDQVGDVLGKANCIQGLGDIAFRQTKLVKGWQQYTCALGLYTQAGSILGKADCVRRLGNIALARSDHAKARLRYRWAIRLFIKVGDARGKANCVCRLADIALERSDHIKARSWFEIARRLFTRVGDIRGRAWCIKSLGDLSLASSDHVVARQLYKKARRLFTQVGDIRGRASCIKGLGDMSLASSDHDVARQLYEEALPLFIQVGAVRSEAECIKSLGELAHKEGNAQTAREQYDKSLKLCRRIGARYPIGRICHCLARLTTEPAERSRFVTMAREAWVRIDRPDLIAELDNEFPPDPTST